MSDLKILKEITIFEKWLRIQQTGSANIADKKKVMSVSGLSSQDYDYVYENYDDLMRKYPRIFEKWMKFALK